MKLILLLASSVLVLVGAARLRRRRVEREHMRRRNASLPTFVDLLRVLLEAGCTPRTSFDLLATYGPQTLRPSTTRVLDRCAGGHLFADALDGFAADVPLGRPLVGVLQSSDRYGIPVTAALDGFSVEIRLLRQRATEHATRRLPILLLFPLVCCILPAFALLTVVPLLGGGLSSLRW